MAVFFIWKASKYFPLSSPTLGSVRSNILGSFTGVWGASRVLFGLNNLANESAYGKIRTAEDGLHAGIEGAVPETGMAQRILTGKAQATDYLIVLYLLNIKAKAPIEERVPTTGGDKDGNVPAEKKGGSTNNEQGEQPTENEAVQGSKGQAVVSEGEAGTSGNAYAEGGDALIKPSKPKNSPDPTKWEAKGGKVEVLDDGTWRYTDWDGNVVDYKNGHPDFEPYSQQKVDIGKQEGNYSSDYLNAAKKSKLEPPKLSNDETTWHHHEDGKTMQEVNKIIHERFSHKGGVSLGKKVSFEKK